MSTDHKYIDGKRNLRSFLRNDYMLVKNRWHTAIDASVWLRLFRIAAMMVVAFRVCRCVHDPHGFDVDEFAYAVCA